MRVRVSVESNRFVNTILCFLPTIYAQLSPQSKSQDYVY